MLARALQSIPLATQTIAKSYMQFPYGASPFFIKKGKGARVWDVDDNEYIDFVSTLATMTLGHGDPDVVAAVKAQLDDGVGFSLPHPLEHQVAEAVIAMVPCAERVRFMKNGADATAAAVRLARAFTGRDHIAICGYHGWQDWYIGATHHHLGVPAATRALSHAFMFNDIGSLQRIFNEQKGDVAAVILEVMNTTAPADGFLQAVKELAHREGAVLIFDEVITGFRFANGGAQERFGVTPDLASFGKALSNGFPLSAIAGRADIMQLLDRVFISVTHGGEALSLAAAKATLAKIAREPVIETLNRHGARAMSEIRGLIEKHDVVDFVGLSGHSSYWFLTFRDAPPYSMLQIQSLFMQEVFARGILALDKHWMSYAHNDNDIDTLVDVYDEVFGILATAVREGRLEQLMRGEIIEPLFAFR
jgi:glutamate-1-semialdehyde 2,1-aminomutase